MENLQNFEKMLSEILHLSRGLDEKFSKGTIPERIWLSTWEVCQRLDLSKRQLATLREKKKILYFKKGKKIYYRVVDVDAYPNSGPPPHQPLA